MARFIVAVVVGAALVYLLLGALLYFRQRNLIYHPPVEIVDSTIESLWLDSGNEKLKIWHLNPGKSAAIIYFGGNAESVWYNHESFRAAFPQHTVYLVNYRGYAGSSGKPTETGLYEDALVVHDWALTRHSSVGVIGRSLGSAIATRVAAERHVSRLALVTPFDSLEQIAVDNYPWFPVRWLLTDKFYSLKDAAKIRTSVLIIMAQHDRIVPRASTERLIKVLSPSQFRVVTLANTDHNNISREPAYADALGEFFN
jgi:uncharacterized protein